MPRRYALRMETRALGAVQIVIGLFHCALGTLCYRLFIVDEDIEETGYIPVIVTLIYTFCSSPFFISSGSLSVTTEKSGTRCKLISAIVLNTISACLSAFGTVILSIACLSYHPENNEYVWSHMVGVMLLQYLLFNAISEVATASIIIHWAIKALYQPEHSEESSSPSESTVSS
ncbi:B-Lymphocyte Antigen Cd20 [Manis pentadactyla]|nr:B-Lymphocyte Antigen Cd20 [Manis pentadactyla]